jgi:hypothetical protein
MFAETNPVIITKQIAVMGYAMFQKIRFSRAHFGREWVLYRETNCHKSKRSKQLEPK